MKALVFENKVIQVEEDVFDVSPGLVWVDIPDEVDVQVGWAYEGSIFIDPNVTDPPTVEELIDHLSLIRFEKENGGLEVSGVLIQTNRNSRSDLLGLRARAQEIGEDFSLTWKAESGFVTLNHAQAIALTTAVFDFVAACFLAEAQVQPEITNGNLSDFGAIDLAFEAALSLIIESAQS